LEKSVLFESIDFANFKSQLIVNGAYPESPSQHKNNPVGAASSREIK
jgi:hypothetical protein